MQTSVFCACNTLIVLILLFFSSAYYIFYIVSRNIQCLSTTSGDPAPLRSQSIRRLVSLASFCVSRFIFCIPVPPPPLPLFLSRTIFSHATFLPHSIFHTQLVTRHLLHASFCQPPSLSHTIVSRTIYMSFFCQPPFSTHHLFFTWQAWHTCGDMTKQIFFCLTPSGIVFFPPYGSFFFNPFLRNIILPPLLNKFFVLARCAGFF